MSEGRKKVTFAVDGGLGDALHALIASFHAKTTQPFWLIVTSEATTDDFLSRRTLLRAFAEAQPSIFLTSSSSWLEPLGIARDLCRAMNLATVVDATEELRQGQLALIIDGAEMLKSDPLKVQELEQIAAYGQTRIVVGIQEGALAAFKAHTTVRNWITLTLKGGARA
jgi:hypothetical protein